MGFTVYYRSTEVVTQSTRDQVHASTDRLCKGKSWLRCEPVRFFTTEDHGGYLEGGSKPDFTPHSDEVAVAETEVLPDGTIRDVIEVLCELSTEFGIDWEFCHDHDPGPVGFIRAGKGDAELWNLAEELGYLSKTLEQDVQDVGSPPVADAQENTHINSDDDDDDDDDDGPHILKFIPRN